MRSRSQPSRTPPEPPVARGPGPGRLRRYPGLRCLPASVPRLIVSRARLISVLSAVAIAVAFGSRRHGRAAHGRGCRPVHRPLLGEPARQRGGGAAHRRRGRPRHSRARSRRSVRYCPRACRHRRRPVGGAGRRRHGGRRARIPARGRRRGLEGRRRPSCRRLRRRPERPSRRRRDRLAPGHGGDPGRSAPRRADRVPARLPAVVLGLPRLRRRLPAPTRRRRRDRAHLPGAARRRRGARPLRVRAQPRHRSRLRSRDRLLAVRRLTLAGGGTAHRLRPRGDGAHPRDGRPHSALQRPHRRRVDGLPARLPTAVPLLDGARRRPRRPVGRARRARAAARVPLLARAAHRRARAATAAASRRRAAAGRGSPPG